MIGFDGATTTMHQFNGDAGGVRVKTSRNWQVGTVLFDDYVIDGIIGQGGLGTVYRVKRLCDQALFAVKTSTDWGDSAFQERQSMIRELRTWLELPIHPQITTCRFFRSLEDRLCIFADYIRGGTLRSWIYQQKLPDLTSRIDVAIQFAWGLKVAHDHGIIHFDVKPANVLMTNEGIAKLTDFGLSRFSPDQAFDVVSDNPENLLTTNSHGLTIAYCSPEQACHQPMTRQTDIWSYGVSLIELFTGELAIQQGFLADFAVDQLQRADQPKHKLLPKLIQEILQGCLKRDPSARFSDMGDVADRLVHAYRSIAGRTFHRRFESPQLRGTTLLKPASRMSISGAGWSDPKNWYLRALTQNRLSQSDHDGTIYPGNATLALDDFTDFELFHAARELYRTTLTVFQSELKSEYSEFLIEYSHFLRFVGDLMGAASALQEADKVLANDYRTSDDLLLHIGVIDALALNRSLTGDHEAAEKLYERGLRLITESSGLNQEKSRPVMAKFLTNLGIVKSRLSHHDQAQQTFQAAQAVLKSCQSEHSTTLSSVLNDFNQTVNLLSNTTLPVFLTRITGIIESLIQLQATSRISLDHFIASALILRAIHGVGTLSESDVRSDISQSAERLGKLIAGGSDEYTPQLAQCHVMSSSILRRFGDLPAALESCGQAIVILDRLVRMDGRSEWTDLLASAYHHYGQVAFDMGDAKAAIDDFMRAESLLDRQFRVGCTVHVFRMAIAVRLALAMALHSENREQELLEMLDRYNQSETACPHLLAHPDCFPEHARFMARMALMLHESGSENRAIMMAETAVNAIDTVLQQTVRSDLVLLKHRLDEVGLWQV